MEDTGTQRKDCEICKGELTNQESIRNLELIQNGKTSDRIYAPDEFIRFLDRFLEEKQD